MIQESHNVQDLIVFRGVAQSQSALLSHYFLIPVLIMMPSSSRNCSVIPWRPYILGRLLSSVYASFPGHNTLPLLSFTLTLRKLVQVQVPPC
jgi:hypothetical protein